jgi:hypothetical protein
MERHSILLQEAGGGALFDGFIPRTVWTLWSKFRVGQKFRYLQSFFNSGFPYRMHFWGFSVVEVMLSSRLSLYKNTYIPLTDFLVVWGTWLLSHATFWRNPGSGWSVFYSSFLPLPS